MCQKTEDESSSLLKRRVVCSMPVTVEIVVTHISGVSRVTRCQRITRYGNLICVHHDSVEIPTRFSL